MPQPFAPITRDGYSKFVYVAAAIAASNGLLFAYFPVPETRGRGLEDIEADLREKAPVRR